MLRRGMKKGIIDRVEIPSNAINLTRINTKPTRARFIYFATKAENLQHGRSPFYMSS